MGIYEENYLMHHGIKGQKHGVRRAEWYPIAAYEAHLANGGESREKGGANSETYRKRASKVSNKKSKLESKNESLTKKQNRYNAKASQAKYNIAKSQANIDRTKKRAAKRDLWDIPHRAVTASNVKTEESKIAKNSEILSKYSALADEIQAKLDKNTVAIDKYDSKINKLMKKADKKEAKELEKEIAKQLDRPSEDDMKKYLGMSKREYDSLKPSSKQEAIFEIEELKAHENENRHSTNGQSLGRASREMTDKIVKSEGITAEDAKKYLGMSEKEFNSLDKASKQEAEFWVSDLKEKDSNGRQKGGKFTYDGPKYSSIQEAKKQSLKDKVSKADYNGDRVAAVTADDAKRLGLDDSTRITGKEESDFWKAYAKTLEEPSRQKEISKASSVDYDGDKVEAKKTQPKTFKEHIENYEKMSPIEMMRNGRGSKSVDEWEAYDSVAYDKAREAYAASRTAKSAAKKSEAKATAYILEGSVSVNNRSNQDIARDLVENGAYSNYDSALKWVNKNFESSTKN